MLVLIQLYVLNISKDQQSLHTSGGFVTRRDVLSQQKLPIIFAGVKERDTIATWNRCSTTDTLVIHRKSQFHISSFDTVG